MNLTLDNSFDNDPFSMLYNLAFSSMASTEAFSLAYQIAFSSSISKSEFESCCKTKYQADEQFQTTEYAKRLRFKQIFYKNATKN